MEYILEFFSWASGVKDRANFHEIFRIVVESRLLEMLAEVNAMAVVTELAIWCYWFEALVFEYSLWKTFMLMYRGFFHTIMMRDGLCFIN